MSTPFIGEIRMFAGTFAPAGWALCAGQLLAISENDALFSLLGTLYGGDGRTTFGLPDLRGRIPVHSGDGISPGEKGGTEQVTLTTSQIPAHRHVWHASNGPATATLPGGQVPGVAQGDFYSTGTPNTTMSPQAMGQTGGGQPHSNIQPFTCINFIIALFGIYPSQA